MRLVRDGVVRSGLTPCPSCSQSTRHRKTRDRRGAVGVRSDNMGWRCHQCDAHGDAVTLASWLCGEHGRINAAVREACEAKGLLDPDVTVRPNRPRTIDPGYPPTAEIAAFRRELGSVLVDQATVEWLQSRKLDPNTIASIGCVGALPINAKTPLWAKVKNVSWQMLGYRLIAPLVDSKGSVRSWHARLVSTPTEGQQKSVNPLGYSMAGLSLACYRARGIMESDPTMMEHARKYGVIIAEGLPDWLTWQIREPNMAIFGMLSGSWTQAHADRLPDGCNVIIATHEDDQGEKYCGSILRTLMLRVNTGRIRVARWRLKQ
jgi:hypothetical protein